MKHRVRFRGALRPKLLKSHSISTVASLNRPCAIMVFTSIPELVCKFVASLAILSDWLHVYCQSSQSVKQPIVSQSICHEGPKDQI